MASQWLKARQTKYAAYAAIYILVVLAILVVVNILANRYNKSYDATANKRYSLSEQTQKIVNGLKQNATITYFNQSTHLPKAKTYSTNMRTSPPRSTSTMSIPIRVRSSRAQPAFAISAPPSSRWATRKKPLKT